MESSRQLADRFREIILNGKWIANTNYKNELSGLSWETATSEYHSLNTVAALTQHIHYYIKGVKNVLHGGTLDIKDKFSFDFPPVSSQSDWETILEKLWTDSEKITLLIEQLPESKLNEAFVDIKYGSYRRNIEALIEHSYYHLGQIVLIKKLLSTSPNN